MRLTKYLVAIAICCFFAISYIGITLDEEIERIIDAQIEIILSPIESATIEHRLESYEGAMEAIQTNPLIGVEVSELAISPHNNLLAHLAYYGILGLIIYLIFFILPYLIFIKKARDKTERRVMWIVFIGGLMTSSMSSLATDVSSQFMYISGLILGVYILNFTRNKNLNEKN
jgi:O-antigen ligase